MTPNARSHRGRGCPTCSSQRVLVGFNDLATTHPEVAKSALFDASAVTAGSGVKENWKCELGHEWTSSVAKRSAGRGCPYCAGKKVLPGFNDLATTHPEIAKEALFDATKYSSQSNKRGKWECSAGHVWESIIYSRLRMGCPFCGGKSVLPGFNDLATTHPTLAAEARFDTTKVSIGSNRSLPWRCGLGHEYLAQPANRSRGDDCPYCSGRRVLSGFNDFATKFPDLAKEALFDATSVTPGSNTKQWWRCSKGHRYKMMTNNRAQGSGCPTCAKYGFSPHKDGWLYLIEKDNDPSIRQIGITNDLKQRLEQHVRNGFVLKDQRGPLKGYSAQEIERTLLRYLKRHAVPISLVEPASKFDGYTETFLDRENIMTSLFELITLADVWESESTTRD